MAKNKLGIGIDQIQLEEQIPLTNYFFWPKIDIWDQIRAELKTKPWISDQIKAELLNSTAVIVNQWQISSEKKDK